MRRREFITLIGGAGVAWPLAARAQQPDRVRRIAVLMSTAADDPESQMRLVAFVQGLQQAGWTAGTTCKSTRGGPREISRAFAGTRQNCSRSGPTSFWPADVPHRLYQRCAG